MEKSPRLSWPTQFLTVTYNCSCSPNVCVGMACISFGALPCRKKSTWWQLASRCCWNRARRLTYFLSASVTRKDMQFGIWTDPPPPPFSKDTIDSVLRHREVGRTNYLSAPPRMYSWHRAYLNTGTILRWPVPHFLPQLLKNLPKEVCKICVSNLRPLTYRTWLL